MGHSIVACVAVDRTCSIDREAMTMQASRIVAVESLELESPPGLRDALRWFYGELVGLEEIAGDPNAVAERIRFRSARLQLKVEIVTAPRIDPIWRRATLLVSDLDLVAEQLEDRGIAYQRISGFVYHDRRLDTNDPAGNRIELKQIWPLTIL